MILLPRPSFSPQHLVVLAFKKKISVKGSLSYPLFFLKLILFLLCFSFDVEHERAWVKWDLLRGVSKEDGDDHVCSWASSGCLQTTFLRDSCSVVVLWLTGSLLCPPWASRPDLVDKVQLGQQQNSFWEYDFLSPIPTVWSSSWLEVLESDCHLAPW